MAKTKKTKLSKRGVVVLIAILTAALAGLTALSIVGWNMWSYRFSSAIARNGVIYIHRSMNFEQTAQMLADSGYLVNPSRWESMAREHGVDSVQMGRYELSSGDSYRTALGCMRYGRESAVRVTFNNIRNVERLSGVVSKYLAADSVELLCAMRDGELIKELGFERATLPAMFLPNTYEVYWSISPEDFMRRMKREWERFWDDERRAKADSLGYSPEQIATLASIVIEETKFSGEMSDVAGVYLNRLRIGMPLQADPTVKFAVGDMSIRRVLYSHLDQDSPYNTYKHRGLPPGPICIPPIEAIEATLACAERSHNYLYFCANPDFSGRHIFTRSLSEHNRNAAAFQAELNRRRIR